MHATQPYTKPMLPIKFGQWILWPCNTLSTLRHSPEPVTEPRVGHCYRLLLSDFTAIDSLSLLPFTVLAHHPRPSFHVTRNKDTCDVNTGDLDKINQLLPPGVCALYEVVTPKGATLGIIIPRSYFTERCSRNPNRTIPVFHYPVDESTLFLHQSGQLGTSPLEPRFIL